MRAAAEFTFHNVSINSCVVNLVNLFCQNLHSTMFLLIHISHLLSFYFKFYLHSTMFLLILKSKFPPLPVETYLHSTMFLLILQPCRYSACLLVKFTFHNVSINSLRRLILFCGKFIYIPQCFY